MFASWLRMMTGQGGLCTQVQCLRLATFFGRMQAMPRLRSSPPRTLRCRIFLDAGLHPGQEIAIPADQAHYLRHVMRLSQGDTLTVFNGRGGECQAQLTRLAEAHASCRVESCSDVSREPPLAMHIIQCANKNEKIETVLQKCTELGAASFQIAVSQRSQFRLAENKREPRLMRWRKIVIEAAEQSGRTRLPDVQWCEALGNTQPRGLALALHPEAATAWAEIRDSLSDVTELTLAVGPEGGFSELDMAILKNSGFATLAFGARIMRTETAAPALLAAIAAVV